MLSSLRVGDFNVGPTMIPCPFVGITARLWVQLGAARVGVCALSLLWLVNARGAPVEVIAGISCWAVLWLLLRPILPWWNRVDGHSLTWQLGRILIVIGGLVVILSPRFGKFVMIGSWQCLMHCGSVMQCGGRMHQMLGWFGLVGWLGLVRRRLLLLMRFALQGALIPIGVLRWREVSHGPWLSDLLDPRSARFATMLLMYRDSSIARLLNLRRRFKAVLDVLNGVMRTGWGVGSERIKRFKQTSGWGLMLCLLPPSLNVSLTVLLGVPGFWLIWQRSIRMFKSLAPHLLPFWAKGSQFLRNSMRK